VAVVTTGGTASAERSWELAARSGYAVSGVLHILIGVLALRLAFGSGGEQADQSGALGTIASTPFGSLVLWFSVVAFVGLGAWQVARAIHGGSPSGAGSSDAADRAKAAGRAVVYLALAVTAFSFARGGGSSSSAQTSDMTARLMGAPGGRVLVGAVGVAILVVGAYHVHKGWTKKFLQDLHRLPSGQAGPTVRRLGVVGYVAKGVALAIVGVLFITAAVQADPSRATGLDGALHTLRDQPAGVIMLVIVALGFVAYGIYSFVRARFGRI
jgi:flagellar biogenesis protein FliO